MNKDKILLYLCIAIFGIVGIYLTFFVDNTNKYDSQTKAYRIYENESYDSDGTTYHPIYYFKVDEKEYECKSKIGSSSVPNENKNIVYYDSSNPENCATEYEKSTGKFAGIICLIATALIVYFFIIRKPTSLSNNKEFDIEKQYQMEENAERIAEIAGKVQLIYKRIILGIIIFILLVFILFDTMLFKQTIKSRNYLETTATYVDRKNDSDTSSFDEYIYTFKDKQGNEQEIVVSVSKDVVPKDKIKIRYNENNPQDYYEEGSTLDKSGIIWYIVKIVVMILLIILFFNKKLLSKVNVSSKID